MYNGNFRENFRRFGDNKRNVVKYGLDWVCETWTGLVKEGFVTSETSGSVS